MIEKFISIRNIGRFRDCSPRGDVTFRKLSLLFAENGRGKTTLCAILRSLQTGQPEFILERKTLGASDPASVNIRLGGNNINFVNTTWSATHPDIALFDSVFVHDNVYAGDYVNHEHKKNLYHVIVGAQGVQLANRIEDFDGKIREANRQIGKKKNAVSRNIPNGVVLDDYLAWQPVTDIDAKIQQKNTKITNCQRAFEKAAEIQAKGLLSKIVLPVFPSDFLTVLAKNLVDISIDAEARVRQQIAAHKMGNQGEMWLSQGLGFVADDRCPFCGQGINGIELIGVYRSHFNVAYKELKQEVAQLTQRVTNSIGENSLNDTQQTLSNNLTLVEFWKQFAEVALPDFSFESIHKKYTTLRDLASALAQKKQQSPTEAVTPVADFQAARDAVTALHQQSVQSYNTAIDTCNSLINAQKSTAPQAADINELKNQLANLEAKKKRFEPKVVRVCKEYQDELTAKNALEQQKSTARYQLDQYCRQIIQTYENSINTYLDQFNAGFRITNSKHQYTGGTPSSLYQIEINNCAVNNMFLNLYSFSWLR